MTAADARSPQRPDAPEPRPWPARIAVRALVALIHLYRLTLSPFIGNQCRFYPSCSRYAEQALMAHGPLRGAWLSLCRLLRCHPFHPGGPDPVPPERRSS